MSEILQLAEAISRLLKADNILLLCHKNPDGDTVGSAMALCHVLKSLGKTAAVLCADPIPSRYAYMQLCLFEDGDFEPHFVVAVDVAGIQLFGDSEAVQKYAQRGRFVHRPPHLQLRLCGRTAAGRRGGRHSRADVRACSAKWVRPSRRWWPTACTPAFPPTRAASNSPTPRRARTLWRPS